MEKRVAELEIRLTFQEKLVEELNEVIIQQQKQLEDLQQDFSALTAKVRDLPGLLADQGAEPLPPHY